MIEGLEPIVVNNFGGLCTSSERGDLPVGLAATATDIEFVGTAARSRRPFAGYLTNAIAPVNSILSYPRFDGSRQRLVFLANGTLQYEYPEATVGTIETAIGNDLIMRGCVLLDRAFMAFSTAPTIAGGPRTPAGRPRQWNGTYFDPVGQDGDSATLVLTSGGAPASGGDADGGTYRYCSSYKTRTGYVTGSSQVNTCAAQPGGKFQTTQGAIGPANVAQHLMWISPSDGDGTEFYTGPPLKIPNNLGGSQGMPVVGPGYSNIQIPNYTPLTHERYANWPLPPCVGLEAYNSRLVAWGAYNYVPRQLFTQNGTQVFGYASGISNPCFDGGSLSGVPVGYTLGTANAGGALATLAGSSNACWQITGNGATANRGELNNVGLAREWSYPPGTEWRVRVRAKRSSGAGGTTGRLRLGLGVGAPPSAFSSPATTQPTFAFTSLTTDWAWYDAKFLDATDATDATASMYYILTDQTLANGEWIAVDDVQVYPTTAPNLFGYLLVSEANDPETFDYSYGIKAVRPGDGQAIVNVAELRGVLFAFKERSIFAVVDNGQRPIQWADTMVSDTVGCISPHAVAKGDGWLITLATTGVYKITGGAPEPISQEIVPTWSNVNWTYKHLAWAVADTESQRVYIGVPTGASTFVNTLIVLDYVAGWEDARGNPGYGRKWSVWTPPATPGFPCGAYIDRDNGQKTFVVGGGVANTSGFVSKREFSAAWGTATDTFGASTPNIMATYDTAPLGREMGRSLFGYVVGKMRGNAGNVGLTLVRPSDALLAQGTRAVASAQLHDVEWITAQTDTDLSLRVANAAAGAFLVSRLAAFVKVAPFSVVRGHNL